jgi:CheY-like chemotaxis protein
MSYRHEVVPLSEVPREEEHAETCTPVVLVVDDEPLVAETLSLILSRAGFAATAVHNGAEALRFAQAIRPAFLLTDVHMPGINGVELALAFAHFFPECKVLLFSGTATAADLAPATNAGVQFPMLLKPIHPTEIIKFVSKSLSRAPNKNGRLDPGLVYAAAS